MAGPYKIAPTSSATPIGMAQMVYGLVNSVDYNHSNLFTSATSSMLQLVTAQEAYQPAYSSSTWNESTPYGIDEMVNQTWNETTFTIKTEVSSSQGDLAEYTFVFVKLNGTSVPSYGLFTASLGDQIQVSGSALVEFGGVFDTAEIYKDATLLTSQGLNEGQARTLSGSFTVASNHIIRLTWQSL